MKKLFLFFATILLCLSATAQTQQGYVKTKGRMVNGKLIPGQGLKGATVSIKGRTAVLVNADDGSFSFPVPETQFCVDSVRKKGYQLVDMDALGKTYKHSTNPLYLVMETPKQQLDDQLAAERKIRRTLTNQLHQKEDEIEALKEQQKITDEEYRQALQKLYEETDQNEQLVKDMVERYSKIDYDQLNEFDQQISDYILNGELTKADSILNTKGDINERISQYRKHKAVNAKEKEELSQRQEQLEQSEALAMQERDDLANDCYRKFEIFKMQHLNDSAAYYLELRAGLDTTNVEWSDEAGDFIQDYIANYDKAQSYLQLSLRHAIEQFGEQSERAATLYCDIGLSYYIQGNYEKSMELYNKGLPILESVLGENHPSVATVYDNIGSLYDNRGDYNKAMEYRDKALSIRKLAFGEVHPDVALSYNNIGCVYSKMGIYEKALEFHGKALSIRESILGEDHLDVAQSYNNIGAVYSNQCDYNKALEYNNKALTIRKTIFGEFHPEVAASYNNIGLIYTEQGDYEKALEYQNKALAIKLSLLGENHPEVARNYNNIGFIYNKYDISKALEYHNKALTIWKALFGENHPDVAKSYNNFGYVYNSQGDHNKALESFFKALSIDKTVYGEYHPDIALYYYNIGCTYGILSKHTQALDYFNKALNVWEKVYGEEHQYTKMMRETIPKVEAAIKAQEENNKNNEK